MKKKNWIVGIVVFILVCILFYFWYSFVTYESLSYCQKIYRETGNCPEDRCERCIREPSFTIGGTHIEGPLDCCEKPELIGVCPSIKHIDCMPIVKPEFEIYCRPENRRWIEENCPEILITD